jgi:peroxiredoxin
MDMPREGDLAPDFTGLTDSGDKLVLSTLRGRIVCLFFYP